MSIEKIGSTLQTTPSNKPANKSKEAEQDNTTQQINDESFIATDTAKKIREALTATGSEPVIDNARIEAVKHQLEAGTYTVDAEKIAEKMIELEQQFSDSR